MSAAPLGFALSSNTGLPPSRLVALSQEVERAGYEVVALTESYNDVLALAGAVAVSTSRPRLVTTIANTGFRHPALMALGAAAVDDLSGGRFTLGLGVGTQWFDPAARQVSVGRPLTALREYVAQIRALLAAGTSPTEASGQIYQLARFHLDAQPVRPRVPIYFAAMGPAMLRLSGQLADGVLLGLTPLETVPELVQQVRQAAVEAGRQPGDVTVALQLRTCLDPDLAVARDGARAALPVYFGFPGYQRHLRSLGYGAVVEAVLTALERGQPAAAARAIPDELVDRVSAHGPLERCLAEYERWRASGLDLLIVAARRSTQPWEPTLREAIAAFAPHSGESRPS